MVEQPAQILQRIRHALQEMGLALVVTAKSIGAQRLHDADVNIGVIVPHEGLAVHSDKVGELLEVVSKQLLTQFRGQVRFGIIKQGSYVVLQRPFAATLVIQKEWMAVPEHDVAGLEVPIEEVIPVRSQKEPGQPSKILFQSLFIEWNAGELEEVVFEVIQIPGNRLPVEAGSRITHSVVQIPAGLSLKKRQHGDNPSIGLHYLRGDPGPVAVPGEKFKEGRIAKILFKVGTLA